MALDRDAVFERHEVMETRRSNWMTLWERVGELVLPRSGDFRSKHSPGTQRNLRQYNAFPSGALDKFAAALESGLIPRNSVWHRLTTGDPAMDQDDEINQYLQDLNWLLWKHRYSPRANFSSQAYEFLTTLGAFGTPTMLIEPRKSGVGSRYRHFHPSEMFIDENAEGFVDVHHRKFEYTARQAVLEWREKTPKKILDKYNQGKHLEVFEFLHVTQPNEDWEPGKPNELPFTGCYYLCDSTKEPIEEVGHYESPYITSRYSVSSREVYGRSPAIQRLPDISMLNEMSRTMIEVANLAADAPMLMHEDVSEFDLVPGAHHPGTVDDNGRPMVVPMQNRSDTGIAKDMMDETRNQIDDGFLGLYFRTLVENPHMTATQAMLLSQQQGQLTAPAVGRQQSEWLGPLLRRESAILYRQGMHPEMPRKLQEYLMETGERLDIAYESPLTRAAESEDAVGLLRSFESLAPFAQIKPTIYNEFKEDEIVKLVTRVNGVPQRTLRTDEERAADQEAEQMREMAGMALQAAPVAASTAKTLAETQAMSQNNPADAGVR